MNQNSTGIGKVNENSNSSAINKDEKAFNRIEGTFENISQIYDKIKEQDKEFDINSYIVEKDEVQEKTFYTLYKTVNGGKTLNGYVIKTEKNRLTVQKSENQRFDINSTNTLSKNSEFKSIDDFLNKNKDTETELKLIKTDLIYQDGKLYNAYSVLIKFEGAKSVTVLYEEK